MGNFLPDSPEMRGFLNTIREAPEDDTHALIFADWLEERGDLRAPFIRATVEYDRHDVAFKEDPAIDPWGDHEYSLSEDVDKAMVRVLPWIGLEDKEPIWLKWRQGYLVLGLGCDYLLSHLPDTMTQLSKQDLGLWIREFNFTGPERFAVSGARALAVSRLPTFITSVNLSYRELADNGIRTLADSPTLGGQLHELNLSFNKISNKGIAALASSDLVENLQVLNLLGNDLFIIRPFVESPKLKHLKELDLSSNGIGYSSYYQLGNSSLRDLCQSHFQSQLTVLRMNDATVTHEGIRELIKTSAFPNLKVFELNQNRLGDPGAEAISDNPHWPKLQTLKFQENEIGALGAEALATSPYLQQLECLDLRDNPIEEPAISLLRERFGQALLI